MQNIGRFGHLHHKSGAPTGEIITSADARENPINRPNTSGLCRYKTTDMRQEYDQGALAHISTFAAHVGAGDDEHACVLIEREIVRDERIL